MRYFSNVLPNGLTVVTVPMKERESAAVAIWVRAGACHENLKNSGVSHFLEHMLFKGTKKRSTKQIKEEIEGVGGMLNAFTGEESTCFFAKLLAPHLPKAMDVLSDMVNHAALSAAEMEKERTVILEEIRMYHDLPAHHVHDLMSELMWPEDPLGWPISGTEKTVAGITRAAMVNYKESFYHPKNIVVSVSGAVDPKRAVEEAARFFPMKTDLRKSSLKPSRASQRRPQTKFHEKPSEQTQIVIGLRAFSRFHPDRYKLALLHVILGGNMSSRLFEEVREKRGLAYEIRTGASFYQDTGAFHVSAGVDKVKAPKAITLILKELEKMRRTLVSEGELRRAKDYFMSQLSMAIEDTLEHLLWAGERVLDGGDLPDYAKIKRSVEAVSREDIRDVAEKIFKNKNLNLALIGPIPEKIQEMIKKDFALNE